MPAPDSDQCVIGPDGNLLDANQIIFYNDPDDAEPLPLPATGSAVIHPFFGHAPATMTAGSRRSTRISRPSTRLMDPDNAETSVRPAPTRKRSATTTTSTEAAQRALRRIKITDDTEEEDPIVDEPPYTSDDDNPAGEQSDDDEDTESGARAGGDTEKSGEDTEPDIVGEAYRTTKAMGDADRHVSLITVISCTLMILNLFCIGAWQ